MPGFGFSLPKLGAGSVMGSPDLPLQDKLMAVAMVLKGDPSAPLQLRQMAMQRQLYNQLLGDDGSTPNGGQTPSQTVQNSTNVQPGSVNGAPLPKIPQMSDLGSPSIPQLGVKADTAPVPPPVPAAPMVPQQPQGQRSFLDPSDPATARKLNLLALINPQAAQALARVQMATRPDLMVLPDNTVADSHDPSLRGRTFPGVDHGQVVLRDSAGNPTGIVNVSGYTKAVSETEGAKTQAQQEAIAAHDLISVPLSNGRSVMMPRSQALAALGGQADGGPSPAALTPHAGNLPGAPAGAAGTLGVAPSAAEQELAKARATTEGTREQAQPEAFAGYRDMSNTTDVTIDAINHILGQKPDPKTGAFVDDPKADGGLIHWYTSGAGANLAPLEGTPAHDLEAQLDVLKGNLAFDRLQQMRDQSPTGGALGRVTQQEINLLSAVRGSLDQGQSPTAFRSQLAQVRNQLAKVRQMRQDAYNSTYGHIKPAPNTPAATPSRDALMAEARRRGLIQ